MNPMTNVKNVLKLSERELHSNMKTSWHDQYKHSAWLFIGGLPFDLTEGDVICVFSQYGEVVNLNLVRDKGTGKSRGFCFLCYEDQRSTNLAVDNFNGIKLLNRTIRVDHCEGYKAPKDDKMDEETRQLHVEGCAPGSKFGHIAQLPSTSSSSNGGLDKGTDRGLNLPPMESLLKIKTEKEDSPKKKKLKKEKKDKKEKKVKKIKNKVKRIFKKRESHSSSSSESSEVTTSDTDNGGSSKKRTQKKIKRKREEEPSEGSESEVNDRTEKRKERVRACSSPDSDSSEEKTRKYSSKSGKEPYGVKCSRNQEQMDNFSERRSRDHSHRAHTSGRIDKRESQKIHRNPNDMIDFQHTKPDRDRNRESFGKYEDSLKDRDHWRGDKSREVPRDRNREDSGRWEAERKQHKDSHRDSDRYRKTDDRRRH